MAKAETLQLTNSADVDDRRNSVPNWTLRQRSNTELIKNSFKV